MAPVTRALFLLAWFGLGCATSGSSSLPAGEPSEVAQPGDPVVTLIDPGAEPRGTLRFRIPAGHRGTMVMDMEMGMTMVAGGTKLPEIPIPPMRLTMSIEVPQVDADGVTHNVSRITAVEVPARAGDRPEVVERVKQELAKAVGTTMTMRFTPRGLVRDVKVTVPEGVAPRAENVLQSMRSAVQQAAAIFPVEPVGQGARWRVESAVDTGAMKLQQVMQYTLERREPNRVWLSAVVDQKAGPQPLNQQGLPPGATASIESHKGEGQARLETALDTRTPTGQVSVRTQTVTNMVMNEKRTDISLDMKLDMRVAPGAP